MKPWPLPFSDEAPPTSNEFNSKNCQIASVETPSRRIEDASCQSNAVESEPMGLVLGRLQAFDENRGVPTCIALVSSAFWSAPREEDVLQSSLKPSGLSETMSLGELKDLIAFLESLRESG